MSGDISLQLPRSADARRELSSVSGAFNGKSVHLDSKSQQYGQGTHESELATVSGDLEVKE